MKITDLSGKYKVKYLSEEDIPEILSLCKSNPQYYEHCPPFATEDTIRKDMTALPPRKTMEDKHYFGFFAEEKLMAVMDLIENYPDKDTAFIGFFMVDKEWQRRGVGSGIISDTCQCLAKYFSRIRLAYVITNEQAKSFWLKNGFEHTGISSKEELYTVNILEKVL